MREPTTQSPAPSIRRPWPGQSEVSRRIAWSCWPWLHRLVWLCVTLCTISGAAPTPSHCVGPRNTSDTTGTYGTGTGASSFPPPMPCRACQQASRQTARDAPDQRGNRVTGAYELDVGLLDDADLLRVDGECHREATRRLLRAGGHKVQRVVEGVTPVSPRRRGGAQLLGLRRPLRCSRTAPSDDSVATVA